MFGLLGILLATLASIYIYRTAKQNGHNAGKWTMISVLTGVALQLVIPIGASIVIAAVWMSSGKSPLQIRNDILMPAFIITVVCIVLNLVAVVMIVKKISLVSDEKLAEPPPPPNEFNLYH